MGEQSYAQRFLNLYARKSRYHASIGKQTLGEYLPQTIVPAEAFAVTSGLIYKGSKDLQAMRQQFPLLLEVRFKQAFPFIVYRRVLSSVSLPQDDCLLFRRRTAWSNSPPGYVLHQATSLKEAMPKLVLIDGVRRVPSTKRSFSCALRLPPRYIEENATPKPDQSQAQQGLLSPLISPSPCPWLWFRQIVDRDSGNLVNPFMPSSFK
eukprot:TRINITY_DN1724_c0_g1_i1.p1 TRINITY_DN1724_c0_g1~~TRINITY_DN1724_c0_g1_i1.p1  ORF type:complete len:207 (-),score=-42.20 TRINITY_DN1724_c0_g1_i1:210-830(-)